MFICVDKRNSQLDMCTRIDIRRLKESGFRYMRHEDSKISVFEGVARYRAFPTQVFKSTLKRNTINLKHYFIFRKQFNSFLHAKAQL